MDRNLARTLLLTLSALGGPVVIQTAYLTVSRRSTAVPYWLDIPVIVAAVALGAICMHLLWPSIGRIGRTVLLATYVIAFGVGLVVYSLGFVCARYDNCL